MEAAEESQQRQEGEHSSTPTMAVGAVVAEAEENISAPEQEDDNMSATPEQSFNTIPDAENADGDKESKQDENKETEATAIEIKEEVMEVDISEDKEDETIEDKEENAENKPFVAHLSSPKIPSLGNVGMKGIKVSQVLNKEMSPTIAPPPPLIPKEEMATDDKSSVGNLNALLACTKSLSFALAKPNPIQDGVLAFSSTFPELSQKRKHPGGCSNTFCTTDSDDLVIAKKPAMLYFGFTTVYKKVHKICTICNTEAESFMNNSKIALMNGENLFNYKPKPNGVDGDVIEVNEYEEDDDPQDVRRLEAEEKTKIEYSQDIDTFVSHTVRKVDAKAHIKKCELTADMEALTLEKQFSILEEQISQIDKDVAETKNMYDKVTGYYQATIIVTEEVDITVQGVITKTKFVNSHLDNLTNGQPTKYPARNSGGRTGLPRTAKENRVYLDDAEILEVDKSSQGQNRPSVCPLAPAPAEIPHVVPKSGDLVYAQNRTLLHYWLKAEVVEVINPGKSPEFTIRFDKRQGIGGGGTSRQVKQVTSKQIAYNIPCPFILKVGTRIIAKFRDELKTEPNGDGQYYAGIVAEPPSGPNGYRYLVFFDDGYAQYVDHNDVLLVYEFSKDVWTDVHPDSSDFIKGYVQKYPERPMVRLACSQVVTTEWNGQWWVARVIELDASLVKMKFENDGRVEWIYRGSTRLSPLFEKQTRQKQRKTARRTTNAPFQRNQPRIEYDYAEDKGNLKSTARKSTSGTPNDKVDKECGTVKRLAKLDYGEFEGTIIKRPIPSDAIKTKEYVEHECDNTCVNEYDESNKEYKKINPLAIPLHFGFSREIAKNPRRSIFYRGPCGQRLRDMEEVYDYLTITKCGIPIDHFTFDLAVDCLNEFRHSRQHSFLPDLTYGKETAPVQVVNAFDYDYPPYVEYSSYRIPGAGVHLNTDDEFMVGCDCEDDCRDKSKCSCWQTTFSGISFTKLQNDVYPVKGYEYRRLKDHIVSGIYECNSRCKCAKTCCNRVAQNGLKVPLQVFKTAAKGWGIRPLFDIPEGGFICIYAGQVLTDAGANEDGKQFGDEYLAELDYIESIESVKEDYESDVTDIEMEESGERSRRRREKHTDSIDMEVDGHSKDSSYRGPKPTLERTISTRAKNGKGSGSGSGSNSKSNSDSEDEGSGGAHQRSHFNADMSLAKLRKKQERKPLREYFGEDEDCYIMDAKTTGNIGRYLNHSCQPNVFVQNVFVDTHDLRFPWVAFFASKHIRAGSELTWDYNYDIGSVPNKVLFCYCGSPDCRGRLL